MTLSYEEPWRTLSYEQHLQMWVEVVSGRTWDQRSDRIPSNRGAAGVGDDDPGPDRRRRAWVAPRDPVRLTGPRKEATSHDADDHPSEPDAG